MVDGGRWGASRDLIARLGPAAVEAAEAQG